jgi:hypothetical protein
MKMTAHRPHWYLKLENRIGKARSGYELIFRHADIRHVSSLAQRVIARGASHERIACVAINQFLRGSSSKHVSESAKGDEPAALIRLDEVAEVVIQWQAEELYLFPCTSVEMLRQTLAALHADEKKWWEFRESDSLARVQRILSRAEVVLVFSQSECAFTLYSDAEGRLIACAKDLLQCELLA